MDETAFSSYENFALLYHVVAYILSSIGFWGIFSKCGIKKWYAWIPAFRIYELSICARKEEYGKILMFTTAVLQALSFVYTIFGFYMSLLTIVLSIVEFVYHMRVYIGICENFGKRKLWIWVWLFWEPVAALIWGYSKNIQQIPEGGGIFESSGNVS